MNPEQIEIARQLIAGAWRGERFDALPEPPIDNAVFRDDSGIQWVWTDAANEWLPDLTDAATGGMLLEMLPTELTLGRSAGSWFVDVTDGPTGFGTTLAEACARALFDLSGRS